MSMILYHYWRSSASWRVRWALELKKIPHEKIHVNLLTGEEKTPDYRKRNPAGYVPSLQVDSKYYDESVAIIEWLEETYPQSYSLLPKDLYLRAKARQITETINSGIQPLQNLDVVKKISTNAETQKEWSQFWIKRGLTVIEEILAEFPVKKFSLDDQPLMPDLFLIPQCYAALRNEINLMDYPRCHGIYEFALSTTECASAHPDKFKTSP